MTLYTKLTATIIATLAATTMAVATNYTTLANNSSNTIVLTVSEEAVTATKAKEIVLDFVTRAEDAQVIRASRNCQYIITEVIGETITVLVCPRPLKK